MNVNVTITGDDPEKIRRYANQVPFAIAMTLTRTAKDVAQHLKTDDLPDRFTLRNRHVQRGIRFEKATKRNLTAKVGTIDKMMVKHWRGGKPDRRKSRYITLPTKAVRKTKRQRITKAKRPSHLLKKRNVDFAEINGKPAIVQTVGRGKGRRTKVLYFLQKKVQYKRTWPFDKIVQARAIKVAPKHFRDAMAYVARTSR